MADAYLLNEPSGVVEHRKYSLEEPNEATKSLVAQIWDSVITGFFSQEADSTRKQVVVLQPSQLPLSAIQRAMIKNESLVRSFVHMPKGWNGYSAEPIPIEVVRRALWLLRELPEEPEIFPTARESIQFEYDIGDRSLEIEIQRTTVILLEARGDEIHEKNAESLLSVIDTVSEFYAAAGNR